MEIEEAQNEGSHIRWIGQQQLLLHSARYNSAIYYPIHFVSNALEEREVLEWKTKNYECIGEN